ncbi:helix-turn-helix domain-containing protein [Phenylobacterium sp.]|uniref:AraC family transcriptional regulator n=1 Tax=Phenylobacterium sp. TaxID=1871053 RepID=UPI00121DF64B|nr:helix-turn-helix domain-containing protein [Phenylobacterium sp.]THD51291.1 MAG: AraC family transcriptional regulator [Phenylobacterium sp.]
MSDPALLVDTLVRGIAAGAMLVTALSVWRSGVSRDVRIAAPLLCLSVAAWLVTEATALWNAVDHPAPLMLMAMPSAGLFWLFILVVFEDRRVTPLTLAPTAVLLITGVLRCYIAPPPIAVGIWAASNAFSGLLALHAAFVIARGWRGDLVEGRRRLRALLLGSAALFSVLEVSLALVNWVDPLGSWMRFSVGEAYGGLIMAAICVGSAILFLQARPEVLGAPRRATVGGDARQDAADRLLIQRLDGVMTAEGWRREGLTIGALAAELDCPEHRLRRLINHRLGHRNFADFLNAHRIEAAKHRLADPGEARTAVAVIAFDLGYGSLGPFNRAFRAATGETPTAWRREAIAASPDLRKAG